MWPYIIGFVVIVGIIIVVMNRRGSTGAGRDYDRPGRADDRAPDPGYGGTGGYGAGDGGGGF